MIEEHPLFQFLDFTLSDFGNPEIDETSIRLPVRDLGVREGFPGYDHYRQHKQSVLVFEGVMSSKREITDNSTGFVVKQIINDGPFKGHARPVFSFELMGQCYERPNLSASVEVLWWITAESVRVEVV